MHPSRHDSFSARLFLGTTLSRHDSFSARLFLGTTLLITAGLCNRPAQAAAPLYSVGTNVISAPVNGTNYAEIYPGPVTVPFSVSDQWVDVSWAAPSAYISVGWSMTDEATTKFVGGKLPIHIGVANDTTGGTVSVMTTATGNFHRGVYNYTSASISATAMLGGDNTGTFVSATTLTDSAGSTKAKTNQVTFTTSIIR